MIEMRPLCMHRSLLISHERWSKWLSLLHKSSNVFITILRATESPSNVMAPPKIDPNLPKASMKIRMVSGKAVNVEFNTSSKIEDIYQYVAE